MKKTLVALVVTLSLAGCVKGPPKIPTPGVPFSGGVQHVVRDILSGYKGFLDEAKINHPECNPSLHPDHPLIVKYGPQDENKICVAIFKAIASHQATHTLLGSYCANADWVIRKPEAVCTPLVAGEGLAQLQTRLFQAIADLGSLINAVKELTR